MPRVCTICRHAQRIEIDLAIVAKTGSYREIAERFGVKMSSLFRHAQHVPAYVAQAVERVELNGAEKLADLVNEVASGAKTLYDACVEWLADPERPGKFYLGPRGEDVTVLLEWETIDAGGKSVRHRSRDLLHNIVQRIESATGKQVVNTSWKHADPRELILKASGNLKDLLDTVVKIQTEAREQRQEHIGTHPDFIKYQAAVASILADYAGALERLEAIAHPIIAGAQRDLPLDGMELSPRAVTPAVLGLIEQTLKGGIAEEET